jgi:hypothetical protein
MGPIRCPETSVKDYHSALRNTPEEHRPFLACSLEHINRETMVNLVTDFRIVKKVTIAKIEAMINAITFSNENDHKRDACRSSCKVSVIFVRF